MFICFGPFLSPKTLQTAPHSCIALHTNTHTRTHTHRFDTLEAAPGGENKADEVNRTCGERKEGGGGGPGMEYGGYRNAILAFCLEYDVDSDSNNDTGAVLML